MITAIDLEEVFRRSSVLNIQHRQLVSIETGEVSNQGHTSVVLRVRLTWSEISENLPEKVIVKIFDLDKHDNTGQSVLIKQLRNGHNVECHIYAMEGLQESVHLPTCYGSVLHRPNFPSLVVLQDLGAAAGLLPNVDMFGACLNHDQVESLLETLSSLHAWSLNTETDWRKAVPRLSMDLPAAGLSLLPDLMLKNSLEKFPDMFRDVNLDKLRAYVCPEGMFNVFRDNPKLEAFPTVLVHGDIQMPNILLQKHEEKIGNDIGALIDWQLAYQGCHIEDLAKTFYWCLSTEMRREFGDKVIDRYVQLFNSKLHDKQHSITLKATKEVLAEMFCFYSLMFGSGIGPFSESFPARMKGATDDERAIAKGYMIEKMRANFEDALVSFERIYGDKI